MAIAASPRPHGGPRSVSASDARDPRPRRPLVLPSGGIATAQAIPGAKLVMFPDMGHDLPRPRWDDIIEEIAENARQRPDATLRPTLVTLDVEGVLLPEIWIAVAERTGIDELRRTTRDEPDYDVLMRGRLDLLDRHGLGMARSPRSSPALAPLPGAVEFLDELRVRGAGRAAVRHVRRVRPAADGPARWPDDPVPRPRRRRRPHRRLPAADGRPEAPRRPGLPVARLPRDRRRRLVQRRLDAPRRRRRASCSERPIGSRPSSPSSRRSTPTTSCGPR